MAPGVPFTQGLLDGPHFAMGGAIFQGLKPENIEMTARLGFKGMEPYRGQAIDWVDRPLELKRVLDQNGVAMVTCSNGGAGQRVRLHRSCRNASRRCATTFAFARDFLAVFGCKHFKMNMGGDRRRDRAIDDIHAIADDAERAGPPDRRPGHPAGAAPAHLGTDRAARARSSG